MSESNKTANDNKATVSNIRNDIISLDMTPSPLCTWNVANGTGNYNLLWICCMCSCRNDALLNKCEICDSDLTNQCEWLQESISINNTNNNNNKPTRKRQRSYTDKIAPPKKPKLSNDKKETKNMDFIKETKQKIRQKYKEREKILKQEHHIQIKRFQKEIKGLQQQNTLLLAQNMKYKTTQQLLQVILNDNKLETQDKESAVSEDVIMDGNNHNVSAASSAMDDGLGEHKGNENNSVIEKQFQCQYCPKRFKTISHKNYHELTHSTAIQYECKQCRAQFTRIEYYRQHLRTQKHKNKVTQHAANSTTESTPQYTKEQKKDANNDIDF